MNKTLFELRSILEELETVTNVMDNLGFLPPDTESAANNEARYLIFRAINEDVTERMMTVLPRFKAILRKLEVAAC